MERPGFCIIGGPDSVLLQERAAAWLKRVGAKSGAWERSVFWGDEPLGSPFWEKLTLQGLFAQPRAVFLRNAQNVPADQLKKLSAALGGVGQDIWPFIFFETAIEKGKLKLPAHVQKLQCVDFAKKRGWFEEVPPLDAAGLSKFVQSEGARLGLNLAPQDVQRVAQALPPDAAAVRSEMEKLALACPDGVLAEEALALLEYSPDVDIFVFLQMLQSGRQPETVWRQFLKDSGQSADAGLFSFIAMLLREARILWQLLSGEQVFLPARVTQSKAALAGTVGYGGLARIWDMALRADKGVKSGEHSPQQAFERLLADLFRLFSR